MKNYILSLLILITAQAVACDICGNFMGITPYDSQGQVALLHRYRVFNGYRTYQQRSRLFIPGAYRTMHHPGAAAGDSAEVVRNHSSSDYEAYKVLELRAKYFLHPRWELTAILPVQQVKTKADESRATVTGLGDPSLFGGYHLVKRLEGSALRQRLIVGAGVKFPLGNYRSEGAGGLRYGLLSQSGTGSWDHFYYLSYIAGINRWGMSVNSLFKINGQNRFHERVGNSCNQVVALFMRFTGRDLKFFPSVLLSYEYSKGVYYNGNLDPDTRMNLLLLGPSLDLSYKQWALNLAWQFNAYERASSQSLSASGRLIVGLTFNFRQGSYLLK